MRKAAIAIGKAAAAMASIVSDGRSLSLRSAAAAREEDAMFGKS